MIDPLYLRYEKHTRNVRETRNNTEILLHAFCSMNELISDDGSVNEVLAISPLIPPSPVGPLDLEKHVKFFIGITNKSFLFNQ